APGPALASSRPGDCCPSTGAMHNVYQLYRALRMITRGSGSRPGGRMVTPTYRTESTSSVHALRTLLILAVSISRGVQFISRTGPCPRTTRVRGRGQRRARQRETMRGPGREERPARRYRCGRSVSVLAGGELQDPQEHAVDGEDDAEGEDPPSSGHTEEDQRRTEGRPQGRPA